MSTLGRYELFDVIGTGGMATVHLARSRGAGGFSRVVAIKRLNEQFARDPDFVAMFVDEARVASRIRHPNVVQIFDVVSVEGELYLVLEYVSGLSLARLGGPLPPAIAVSLMIGVLDGLHAAHEARDESGRALQIVHRDVSPQNVLVGSDGIAHLLDFGIAKAIGRSHVTRDGALKGKLQYMAPEQLRGEAVTRSVDVYAAAVNLWEALTGRALFTSEEQPQLVVDVLSAPIRPPSALGPGIPPALDAVVLRGLDRERTRRYPTAAAMARALEQALAPASANAVADWLASIEGAALEERARLVAQVESAPLGAHAQATVDAIRGAPPASAREATRTEVTVTPPRGANAERERKRRPIVLAIIAFACAGVLTALVAHRTGASESSAPSAPAATDVEPATATPPPESAPDPSGAAPAAANTNANAAAEPRSGHAHGSHATAAPRSTPGTRGGKTAQDPCDPPYTMEGERKVWKRNCL